MNRGVWQSVAHGVTKTRTQLSNTKQIILNSIADSKLVLPFWFFLLLLLLFAVDLSQPGYLQP